MPMKAELSKTMTEEQFDNGYWYAVEVKAFAKDLGILSTSKLRKDELEKLIKHFLRTGKIKPAGRKILARQGSRDTEKGLSLELPVLNYTNDKATKEFIVAEAHKAEPGFKEKSGARYRLNRWREDQVERGVNISYGDLVTQYIELNKTVGSFPQVPVGRYINFLSDFLGQETGATRDEAITAWKELKALDVRKTYQAWKEHKESKSK